MSIFAGLANAKISETGSYLPPGFRGKLRIDKCQIVHPRSGIPAFVVDLTVITSNLPDVKPGEVRNWYQKSGDSFDAAVLGFLAAALGFNAKLPDQKLIIETQLAAAAPQYAEAAVGPTQFLANKEISVETMKRDTKAGGEFTRHDWAPASA